jgi:hypothetical protein
MDFHVAGLHKFLWSPYFIAMIKPRRVRWLEYVEPDGKMKNS